MIKLCKWGRNNIMFILEYKKQDDEQGNKQDNYNILISKKLKNILYYSQTSCIFCYNNFKNDIIKLQCKHIFDLNCFITYTKLYYLENICKLVKCPICRHENNILCIFKKYKFILKIRLFMSRKRKITNSSIYIYEEQTYRRTNVQKNKNTEKW
jgi:hypothetical protein